MKKVLFFIMFSLFLSQANAQNLEASIKYDENSAKIEAFKGVYKKIDRVAFEDFLRDKNRKQNLELMNKKITEQQDRFLCPFYLNEVIVSYAVTYKNNPKNTYYYNILGSLEKVDIQNNETKFPKRILSYSRYGNLIGVIFETSEEEEFVYDKNGKLLARWLNQDMYDKEDNFPKFLKLKRGILE